MNKKTRKAINILKSGGVIAFPTETVFGIGACISQPKAIRRIFKIKGRPRSKPLQILVASIKQAQELGKFSQKALGFAKKKWPGPYTLVVYKTRKVPKLITGGSSRVGLRMPNHRVALALIKACGPIAATSANLSGKKPILQAKEVKKSLPRIDFVVSGKTGNGKASQVIDTTRNFKILRA